MIPTSTKHAIYFAAAADGKEHCKPCPLLQTYKKFRDIRGTNHVTVTFNMWNSGLGFYLSGSNRR